VNRTRKDAGAILILVIAVLLGLSLIGIAIIRQGTVAGVETAREVGTAQAFWAADAGIEEARAIAYRNKQGGESLVYPLSRPRTWQGSTDFGDYTVTITQAVSGPPRFVVISDAFSHGGDQRTLSLNVNQEPALIAGVFGESSLRLQPKSAIYSYHSSSNPAPTASDSTGEAIVGSNESIRLQPGTDIDGTVMIGADTNGLPATTQGCEAEPCTQAGWIDPDPLGIRGGYYGTLMAQAVTVNNNASVPHIAANAWTVPNNATSTIAVGTYYLVSAEIRGTVVVNSGGGPVEIFLAGPFKSWPGSRIGNPGAASQFRIYSNSQEGIDLQPDGDFSGFIYAPYSVEVKVRPDNNFFGAVWGDAVTVLPGNDFYVDMDLLTYDAFSVYSMDFNNWTQIK
jgi:hypothetical protein